MLFHVQYWAKGKKYLPPLSFDCEEGGRNIQVFPMDGADLRSFWERMINAKMINRTAPDSHDKAYLWAARLGASHLEAEHFTTLQTANEISDFIAALVNRSGLLKFQPWITRDINRYIQMSDLPSDTSYDAIHVRRGDKLIAEAKKVVANYWSKRGYKRGKLPTNYVPFKHYLELGWEESTCPKMEDKKYQQADIPHRIVYVATDDPATVQKEISELPTTETGDIKLNECQKARFIFSPASKTTDSFHMTPCQDYGSTCGDDDCSKRYERNIAAMADLVILVRSDKFVGEYNSNWGRLVRGFRTIFDPMLEEMLNMPTPVLVREVVEVFGYEPEFFSY